MASAAFGGLPATGALARTAANVRAGARSPVSGIVHAATVLAVILVAAPAASYIPLPTLSAVLVVVALNMGKCTTRYIKTSSWASRHSPRVLYVVFLLI
jgi:SulP family sulfate permease